MLPWLRGILAAAIGAAAIWAGMHGHVLAWGLLPAMVAVIAVRRAEVVILGMVALALLGGGWEMTRLACLVMIVASAAAFALAPSRIDVRPAHILIAGLGLVLTLSWEYPDVLAIHDGYFDLISLLCGLVLLGLCAAIRLPAWALFGFAAVIGASASAWLLYQADYANGRLVGLSLNPNYLGALLALPLVAALGLAWHRRELIWLLPAAVTAAGLVATESRGATIAAVCGCAYLVLAGRRWWTQALGMATAAAVAFGLSQVIYLAPPPPPAATAHQVAHTSPASPTAPDPTSRTADQDFAVRHDAASGHDVDGRSVAAGLAEREPTAAPSRTGRPADISGSRTSDELTYNNDVRRRAAVLAFDTAWEHPLRGIGYSAFAAYAQAQPRFGIYMNTHNDYLRLAAESGAPALLLLLALLALGLLRRRGTSMAVPRALVVCYAISLVFANTLSNLSISIIFWVALGMLLARPREENDDTGTRAGKVRLWGELALLRRSGGRLAD